MFSPATDSQTCPSHPVSPSILRLPFFAGCTIRLRKHLVARLRKQGRGAMNVHVSYRLHKIPAVEKDIQHQIEKLQKRLQVFRPELIHLKGVVEEISPREGTSVSLNLRLPSGQMAVQVSAATAAAAVKSAFEDLLQQVNKHKEILRASHKWQRGTRGDSARPGAACARSAVREDSGCGVSARLFPRTTSAPTSTSIWRASSALSNAKSISAKRRTSFRPIAFPKKK